MHLRLTPRLNRRTLIAASLLAAALPWSAHAVDVAGVNVEPTAKVAGKELKLNGAGVRTRVIIKVYVMALYLTEKKDTAAAVLDAPGPRRFALTMLREVTGDDFGQAFMAGITANTDKSGPGNSVADPVYKDKVITTYSGESGYNNDSELNAIMDKW